jgi:hypothetical protein
MIAIDGVYVIGATSARAVAQFVRQFGHAPARVFQSGHFRWCAGPVENESARRGAAGTGRVSAVAPNKTHDEPTQRHDSTGEMR